MSSSLADELLADLGGDEDAGEADQQDQQDQRRNGANGHLGHSGNDNDGWGDMDEDGDDDGESDSDEQEAEQSATAASDNAHAVKPAREMARADVDAMDMRAENSSIGSVRGICKLMDSSAMRETLRDIEHYRALPRPDIDGILEESPEYHLIVKANNLAVEVDNEVMMAHKYIRDRYSPRFPELETLIRSPWDFVQAVQAIGNADDLTKARLDGILAQGTIIVISMTASTTKGRKLKAEAWQQVEEACKLVFELDDARKQILDYVESRMAIIAPSLSKVVGSRVATKLLGVAGGLTALTKIPACNVGLLGASKATAEGMSTSFSGRHKGFVVQAPLVANTPEEYHRQAIRIVSAKALLAARVDAGGNDRFGQYGAKLARELEQKLEKLQEPPPAKMKKTLPKPLEGGNPKKRRGGRRARQLKERYGMTELHKMQNRVRFGQEEEETGAFDETVGMGMLGNNAQSNKLRAQASKSNAARMSKRNMQRIAAMQNSGSAAARLEAYGRSSAEGSAGPGTASSISGTATSLSFTPVQGIELADPSRQSKVEAANAKWFREGMFSLAPGATSQAPPSAATSGMGPPSLPSKKPRTGT